MQRKYKNPAAGVKLHDSVTAFLPCRKGSERVAKKNTRPFGPFRSGLLEIKISQLLECNDIDEIVLSTNDEEIIDFAVRLGHYKIRIHRRDENLSTNVTSTDELINHANELITSGHILWTHVTSPFVGARVYSDIIASYRNALMRGHDSLMTTTKLHAFLWGENGPVNYDRTLEKWPRTQTIKPIHEINSAAFLAPVDIYRRHNDRIGLCPLLYPLDRLCGFDIDWEEDFTLAELLLKNGLKSI
jgi:CMP-N-acetylneuraminic acid synthetase